ncbi:hypothetical protein POM88_046929 [Heracleum sosnowskyi]|uniref:C3H1-type domain-containing protein n=1 Tax=Heracleum sosnowskyi TaxID=360622 RepID=A0AAD8HAE7_9APIA|nr:hypothetical protein POM88_046929 [Heracleum sosnowskyi]
MCEIFHAENKSTTEGAGEKFSLTGCSFGEECNFKHTSLSENDQIAKVTFPVDKSFVIEISGEDETNSRVISLMSEASLSIKDHRSDSSLKNVEIQGTSMNLYIALELVEQLTVGTRATCHFAHGAKELRNTSPTFPRD